MPKSREITRANSKMKKREEYLNTHTEWGIKDPTPAEAVKNIITERRTGWTRTLNGC